MSSPFPSLDPVDPTRPCAPYLGGKRALAKALVAAIAATPHTAYAEVFLGMDGVFLRRDRRPKAEVINDLNGDVANFFRILQRHYVAFLDMLRYQLTTRKAFERLKATDPGTLTDLERAARFLYLQRVVYGGHPRHPAFGVDPGRSARFDLTKLVPMLEAVHDRLAGVVIEGLDWRTLIDRYDFDGMLFYLDPP